MRGVTSTQAHASGRVRVSVSGCMLVHVHVQRRVVAHARPRRPPRHAFDPAGRTAARRPRQPSASDAQQAATYDRKRRVKDALESGKPLQTEDRADADRLRGEIELEDASRGAPSNGIDNEYANAGVADPKVLVTTSHDPSSKLTQFLKEVKLLIPNSTRMNRGGNTVAQIVETCRADGFTDLVVLQEHRGIPDGIVISHMPCARARAHCCHRDKHGCARRSLIFIIRLAHAWQTARRPTLDCTMS